MMSLPNSCQILGLVISDCDASLGRRGCRTSAVVGFQRFVSMFGETAQEKYTNGVAYEAKGFVMFADGLEIPRQTCLWAAAVLHARNRLLSLMPRWSWLLD